MILFEKVKKRKAKLRDELKRERERIKGEGG
jgi:hypothetical protein